MPRMQGNSVTIGGQTNNYFFIDWSSSNDPANNRTLISWAAYFHFTSADSQLDNGNADLNGSRWANGGRVYNISSNFTTRDLLLASGSFYQGHNSNGEATLSVSGGITLSGGARSSGSASWALTNYDRKPAAPSTITLTLNADKSITVSSNVVSSPAGTATYYIGYSSSSDGGSTLGAWSSYTTIPSNSNSYTYAANTLTAGLTYRFRMYASNTDGSSAATTSATNLFLPAGGKIYNGTAWVNATNAKILTGSGWQTIVTAKIFNGTSWVNLT